MTIRSSGITRSSRPNLKEKKHLDIFSVDNTNVQRPGGLADVSVPDVVREDALSLVLQHLNAARLGQPARLRLEEYDGLHAAALGGVRRHVAEPGTLLICETTERFRQGLILQKWPMASEQAQLVNERNNMEKMIQLNSLFRK